MGERDSFYVPLYVRQTRRSPTSQTTFGIILRLHIFADDFPHFPTELRHFTTLKEVFLCFAFFSDEGDVDGCGMGFIDGMCVECFLKF